MSIRKAMGILAVVAVTACYDDLQLAAYGLEVAPNPAVPGDQVSAAVLLTVNPPQRHTIILMIDSVEHFRVTSSEVPPRPYVIPLGDAADLIAAYGAGTHSARLELRAEESNRSAGTRSVNFELQPAAP